MCADDEQHLGTHSFWYKFIDRPILTGGDCKLTFRRNADAELGELELSRKIVALDFALPRLPDESYGAATFTHAEQLLSADCSVGKDSTLLKLHDGMLLSKKSAEPQRLAYESRFFLLGEKHTWGRVQQMFPDPTRHYERVQRITIDLEPARIPPSGEGADLRALTRGPHSMGNIFLIRSVTTATTLPVSPGSC